MSRSIEEIDNKFDDPFGVVHHLKQEGYLMNDIQEYFDERYTRHGNMLGSIDGCKFQIWPKDGVGEIGEIYQ